MEGRLLDFDDQGYVPTPGRTDEKWADRQRRRRREEEQEMGGDGGGGAYYHASLQEGKGLRRRHGVAVDASPIPPAIAPIGVAPALGGGGGGK